MMVALVMHCFCAVVNNVSHALPSNRLSSLLQKAQALGAMQPHQYAAAGSHDTVGKMGLHGLLV